MATGDRGRDRRRRARVAVEGEVLGRIHASTPVLDISESGALLEISTVLRPGSVYLLRLTLGDDRYVHVKSRVVRTYVYSVRPKSGGQSHVAYQAAVEFVEVPDDVREALRAHVGSVVGSLDMEFD